MFVNRFIIGILITLSALVIPAYSQDDLKPNVGETFEEKTYELNQRGMLGGINTKISSYPFQAALLKNSKRLVGSAVLIGKRWALTTAKNLIYDPERDVTSPFSIRVGSDFPNDGGTVYEIESIFVHPNFTGHSDNDIALIYTDRDIETTSNVETIQISERIENYEDITVIGWGGQGQLNIQYLKLNILDYNDCKAHYLSDNQFTNTSFCTAVLNYGPCEIDHGSPVVQKKFHWFSPEICINKLVGLFSGTKVCGSIVFPAIYTDVTRYKIWIETVVNSYDNTSLKS